MVTREQVCATYSCIACYLWICDACGRQKVCIGHCSTVLAWKPQPGPSNTFGICAKQRCRGVSGNMLWIILPWTVDGKDNINLNALWIIGQLCDAAIKLFSNKLLCTNRCLSQCRISEKMTVSVSKNPRWTPRPYRYVKIVKRYMWSFRGGPNYILSN